ncbi:MAG: hypothetical protein ACREMS_09710 [Gemmatimonadaceae bacterium]
MMWSRTGFTLALGIAIFSARPARCQQLQLIEAGVKTPDYAEVGDTRPSDFQLTAKSVGWSAYGSIMGGVFGLDVDGAYCKRHHRGEESFLFGPCFLYTGDGAAAGWFGGAVVGATFGAARVAEKRGCPRGTAIWRAMIGAAVGSTPGALIIGNRSGNYSSSASAITAAAPLLSGIGAAVAVLGCHA